MLRKQQGIFRINLSLTWNCEWDTMSKLPFSLKTPFSAVETSSWLFPEHSSKNLAVPNCYRLSWTDKIHGNWNKNNWRDWNKTKLRQFVDSFNYHVTVLSEFVEKTVNQSTNHPCHSQVTWDWWLMIETIPPSWMGFPKYWAICLGYDWGMSSSFPGGVANPKLCNLYSGYSHGPKYQL